VATLHPADFTRDLTLRLYYKADRKMLSTIRQP